MPTSQIIVTSRYIKSGTKQTKTKRTNFTKYIATRESVEKRPQNNSPVTKKQIQLINDLLSEFPKAKLFLEYEDYSAKPTAENASELISTIIERYADVLGNRRNFVGYMAMRPGAEKRGAHGLFNDSDKPIDLNAVADEVANHPGNIWTHVVSLRREDAVRLGYTNSDMWRELVKRHIADIAKAQNIPLANLKWYAAFHNTTHHPHIHLIVYSTNPKQGYLTKQGIEKIRSVFANDIFHDDLKSIYQQQTLTRDELKALSENQMKEILSQIGTGVVDEELVKAIEKLHGQLQTAKGKKVYGYLPKEVKQTVDEIFSMLADDEHIKQLYEKWCELEDLKYKTYTLKPKSFPFLTENKEFRSVKNMIIRTVLNMDKPLTEDHAPAPPEPGNDDTLPPIDYSDELSPDDFIFDTAYAVEVDVSDFTPPSKYALKWSEDYKSACEKIYDKHSKSEDYKEAEKLLQSEAAKGNALAIHDLGKLYATDKLGAKDDDKSAHFYAEALTAFMDIEPNADYMFPYESKSAKPKDMRSYVWYRIGKMYCYGLGTEQNYMEAFKWFEKSAIEGNKYAQFSLANLYYYGNGADQSYEQAYHWYMKAAKQGQPYAAYAIAQMYANGEYVSKDESEAKRYYKQALAGFLKLEVDNQADDNLLYKIGRMFKLGLGTAENKENALDYFKRSAALNNKNGLYEYGKALLLGEGVVKDTKRGEKLLQKAIALGNDNAKRFLALEYISGENVEQDIDKGIDTLTELADGGDTMSAYKLGKIFLSGEVVFTGLDKAEKYLRQAADNDNEYAMYSLAKMYLLDEKKELPQAVRWLEKACDFESIKPYAAYAYAKILLDDNEFHNTARAIELLEETTDENNWCSYLLGKLYLLGNDDVEKDKEKAVQCLTKSADDGNAYAEALLQHAEDYERSMMTNTVMSLFAHLARIIEDDYMRSHRKLQSKVDRKLRRIIEQKKEELGIKTDNTIHYDY